MTDCHTSDPPQATTAITDGQTIIQVPVELAERSYTIYIGENILSDAGRLIAPTLKNPRSVIVTDENVAPRHLKTLETSLNDAGIAAQSITLPAGEGSKDWATLQKLIDRLLDLKLERRDMIIALGGGVIGDLVGFAAAILRRGVDFIQIPTTLLAQVDSSVGGKTAINVPQGKNLIGAFHQPRLVIADMAVLDTLPKRELLAGYAEVVKYGLLGDAEFFDWLEEYGPSVINGDRAALAQAVSVSCQAKARIVAEDEREGGVRALLNLGHTFGHALEAMAGYGGSLLHGEGVAIGMAQAFAYSHELDLCPGEDVDRVRRHLKQVGLPVTPRDAGLNHAAPEELLAHMQQDKKVEGGKLVFILARGIGDAYIDKDVSSDHLKAFLKAQQNL